MRFFERKCAPESSVVHFFNKFWRTKKLGRNNPQSILATRIVLRARWKAQRARSADCALLRQVAQSSAAVAATSHWNQPRLDRRRQALARLEFQASQHRLVGRSEAALVVFLAAVSVAGTPVGSVLVSEEGLAHHQVLEDSLVALVA